MSQRVDDKSPAPSQHATTSIGLPKGNTVHAVESFPTPKLLTDEAAWREERRKLLRAEKELTRRYDAMIAERRKMPWLQVVQDYTFYVMDASTASAEPVSFFSLVPDDGKPLLVQHIMFGADWARPCSNCSMWFDGYHGLKEQLSLLANIVGVCEASPEKITQASQEVGWTLPIYSAAGSTFSRDFHMSQSQREIDEKEPMGYNFEDGAPNPFGITELPGASVFAKHDGKVYLVNSIAGRGLEPMCAIWAIADLLPNGRGGRNLFPHREAGIERLTGEKRARDDGAGQH